MQAIHDAGYVYRDLKPQNVLLDSEGKVRISDMGLTANITGGTIKQCSGTRGYWSPETIQKQPYQCEPDWWSLGVTMFVLHSDKMPFHGALNLIAATCLLLVSLLSVFTVVCIHLYELAHVVVCIHMPFAFAVSCACAFGCIDVLWPPRMSVARSISFVVQARTTSRRML